MREGDALLVCLPIGHNFPLASPGIQGMFIRSGTVVLADSPRAADVFPLVAKEKVTHLELVPAILIRLLRSPIGVRVAQMGFAESNVQRIAEAISWLRENYSVTMRVEQLAELANMSVSSFHEHFKAVTTMSPLNYQKVLRLQEARRLMLSSVMDAGAAGLCVGYLSASQFSREYSRFFGCSPTKDISRLRQEACPAGLTQFDATA